MVRKLEWLLLVIALALPASAAGPSGTISGTVRNSAGVPQAGATVEIFVSSLLPALTVLTDTKGFFSATGIDPGKYQVKVSAPPYLPSVREDVALPAGASLVVNVTLNTLLEGLQMLPARRQSGEDQDDWKWTLRSTGNRPILRVLDDGPLVVAQGGTEDDRVLKARVSFLAGSESDGFNGSPDMTTSFNLEHSIFSAGTLSLGGNVAYNGGLPGTAVRAAYSQQLADGSRPEIAITARRFATPESMAHNAALQALALSFSDQIQLADFVELNFGSEYQTIQFMGRVSALKPFGSIDLHLAPDTELEYRYATSVPNTRQEKGFDSAPADLTESGPRVSMSNFEPLLERARHHEISLSQRAGKNTFQVAAFTDRIQNPALTGVGEVSGDSGNFLPDVYSGTFTYGASALETNGLRVVYQRKLTEDLTATVDYSYGGVIELDRPGSTLENLNSSLFGTVRRNSVAWKFAGSVPGSKTDWITSYRWTSGGQALTPVDMFNVSSGQSDPYLNVFVRQPLPGMGFVPGHMEALVDVRNLLAQGYVPVIGQDGRTLYLVQSARTIRGGVAFTF